MDKRLLGGSGVPVLPLGLGCMGMSEFYGGRDDAASAATLLHALDRGVQLIDTADMYGNGHNEQLVGAAIRSRRSQVVLCTKFGIVRDPADPTARGVCGRPDYVLQACERSLQRLGVDCIDLYYQHRVDPEVPIEETVGAMARLVEAGKVRWLGLSEASADTIRRAHAAHPIAAVQSELSLWTREPESAVLPTCAGLGIAFVAYSPLGRGIFGGAIASADDLAADDYRRRTPRFAPENLERNLRLVDQVKAIAAELGATPAQLALAWVLAHGDRVLAIPGTKRRERVDENLGALELTLPPPLRQRLDDLFAPGAVAGTRYPAALMGLVNR